MSRLDPNHQPTSQRFPRVSGDEPRIIMGAKRSDLFSPRERG